MAIIDTTVRLGTVTLRYNKVKASVIMWVQINLHQRDSGSRLNKKDGLTRYGDSHVKDKTS